MRKTLGEDERSVRMQEGWQKQGGIREEQVRSAQHPWPRGHGGSGQLCHAESDLACTKLPAQGTKALTDVSFSVQH